MHSSDAAMRSFFDKLRMTAASDRLWVDNRSIVKMRLFFDKLRMTKETLSFRSPPLIHSFEDAIVGLCRSRECGCFACANA